MRTVPAWMHWTFAGQRLSSRTEIGVIVTVPMRARLPKPAVTNLDGAVPLPGAVGVIAHLTPQQFESNYVAANGLCNANPEMHLGTIMWSRFALQPDGTYPVGNTSVTIASAKYRAVIKRYP